MGRGEGGNRKGETGNGKREGKKKHEEGGISQMVAMLGWTYGMPWNEITEFFDFVWAGTPLVKNKV